MTGFTRLLASCAPLHTPHTPHTPHSTAAVSLPQVTRLLKEKFTSEFKAGRIFENGKLKRHTRLAEKCFFRADDPCAAPPAAAHNSPRDTGSRRGAGGGSPEVARLEEVAR